MCQKAKDLSDNPHNSLDRVVSCFNDVLHQTVEERNIFSTTGALDL